MKKSLLALALTGLVCALSTGANVAQATKVYDKDGTSLDLYGRVQSVFYNDKSSGVANGDDKSASINTSGRLGFKLRSAINQYAAGIAKAEWDVADGDNAPDGDQGFKSRYLWVGMDFGAFGQVTIGKQEHALKYAVEQTDVFEDWGCVGLMGNDDKDEAVVKYAWSGYGVDAFLSYSFAKNAEKLDGAYYIDEEADLDYQVSAALGYTSPDVLFGPIAARVGFTHGEFADVPDHSINRASFATPKLRGALNYDSFDQYALGLSWGSLDQGPYLAAAYVDRSFDVVLDGTNSQGTAFLKSSDYSVTGYELLVGYTFTSGVFLVAGYEVQDFELEDLDLHAATVPVYLNWNINPNLNAWLEARFDVGSDDDEDNVFENFDAITGTDFTENIYSAGLRYSF